MQIQEKLVQGKFIKRYKRFFADVQIGDDVIVAHVANTGSLKTCLYPDADCIISESTDPKRKLKATLHFIKTPSGWAGVNTSHPNALVHEAWTEGLVTDWKKFKFAKREVKISAASRIDLVLARDEAAYKEGKALHHIEVKNVTLVDGVTALFPDAVTERGQKHLRDLMELIDQGHSAEMVYVVQREGCSQFSPADDIDHVYGQLLREAYQHGVKISIFACDIDPKSGLTLNPKPLKLNL